MTTAATTMIMENKAEEKYAGVKTSVWWDIENCEVPRGWDAHAIAQNVSSALLKMDYSGSISISAYGDTDRIPRDVAQALSSTGVRLNHVPAGVKDASDKKILVDMCLWAADNPAPANFMLISGDRDFSYALHQLRMRTYNILLAQPSHASAPLVAAAKSVWLWKSLASGGLPLSNVEPSRLLNNGLSHVSNHDIEKDPVPDNDQSRKPTDLTSGAVDTKDLKTRENQVPGRLPQEMRQAQQTGQSMPQCGRGATGESVNAQTRENMPQSGRGATCEFVNAHLLDKSHISQAAFLASRKAPYIVSAKPIQETKLAEHVFCQVCQISCINKETYHSHKYGKRHRNNLELQSCKTGNISGGPVEPPKEVLEKQKKKYKCYRCGSMNHKVRDCPEEDLRAKVQGTNAGTKLCYNCGELGHFKMQCPKLVQSSGKRASEGYSPPAKRSAIMPCVYSMAEESTDPSTFHLITGKSLTREFIARESKSLAS